MGVVGEGMVALGMVVIVAHGTGGENGPGFVGAWIAQMRTRLREGNNHTHALYSYHVARACGPRRRGLWTPPGAAVLGGRHHTFNLREGGGKGGRTSRLGQGGSPGPGAPSKDHKDMPRQSTSVVESQNVRWEGWPRAQQRSLESDESFRRRVPDGLLLPGLLLADLWHTHPKHVPSCLAQCGGRQEGAMACGAPVCWVGRGALAKQAKDKVRQASSVYFRAPPGGKQASKPPPPLPSPTRLFPGHSMHTPPPPYHHNHHRPLNVRLLGRALYGLFNKQTSCL